MKSFERKRVLVCPLDWGLGHATRCIPIIQHLIECGQDVIIAADGRPLALLKKEFPSLHFVQFPGYNIKYYKGLPMGLSMLLQAPKILWRIRRENIELKNLITENKIDGVISDNRYGLYTSTVPSVFMTHQVMVKMPTNFIFLQKLSFLLSSAYAKRYKKSWIPDIEDSQNLSGELSHKYRLNLPYAFIGFLSRFKPVIGYSEVVYDVMVLLSGPEPRRTLFEERVINQLKKLNYRTLIVRGITECDEEKKEGDLTIVNSLTSAALENAILSSALIICRPGYSTLMDLAVLGKKALLVPTPGQTEQEYLAKNLLEKGCFFCVEEQNLDLALHISKANTYPGLKHERIEFEKYKTHVQEFLDQL